MNRTRVVFIGFAALLPLYPAAAQTTIEVASKVPYRLCRIEAVRVIDFGDADGAGIIESDVAATVRDGRGRYYVTEGYGSPIKVFDAAGSFLNTIGWRGSGPGESEAIAAVRVCRGGHPPRLRQRDAPVDGLLRSGHGGRVVDWNAYHDTVIVVSDPETGRLLSRSSARRLRGPCFGVAAGIV